MSGGGRRQVNATFSLTPNFNKKAVCSTPELNSTDSEGKTYGTWELIDILQGKSPDVSL